MGKRKIYIECDGGFGNRFNELITGLSIARLFNLEPVVVWPKIAGCMAGFDDLFDNSIAEILLMDSEQFSAIKSQNSLQFMVHEHNYMVDDVNRIPTEQAVMRRKDLNELYDAVHESNLDIHFSTNLIPPYLDLGLISSILDQLVFLREITDKVHELLALYSDKMFFGLHARLTDFNVAETKKQEWKNLISEHSDKLFFICSDSAEFEKELINNYRNVFCFPKHSYVEKVIDGDWQQGFAYEGRIMRFNVKRSSDSVKEAMVDLLLLSESEIIKTSNSTFLRTALLLRAKKRGLLKFGMRYGDIFYV